MMRWLCGVVLTLALAGCEGESASQKALAKYVGLNVREAVVQTLDGEPQPLADLLLDPSMGGAGGKPVLLNVWATWCPPCVHELPELDALGKNGQVKVIAIATDREAQTVKDFLRDKPYGSGLTVWFDSQGVISRQLLGATALPSSYMLNDALTITRVFAGPRVWTRERLF